MPTPTEMKDTAALARLTKISEELECEINESLPVISMSFESAMAATM
jgi:hypothetical protein